MKPVERPLHDHAYPIHAQTEGAARRGGAAATPAVPA